jgi:hypothetical protein
MVEARRVQSIADDVFGEGAAELGEVRLRGGDALLAELERARTGVMLDIVATIQLEQDEVIRAPLPGVLTVQGGPGTGKTAIGLHRAAYLLYNHPELARAEVMVVGPSRAFLGYIAQVLPSLGEEAVLQVTLADLVPDVKARAAESDAAQLVKGDARMANVIANAVARRRRDVSEGFVVRVGLRRAAVEASEVSVRSRTCVRDVPYKFGRACARLVSFVYRRMGLLESDPRCHQSGQADPVLRRTLGAVWPAVSPKALVRDLLSNAEQLVSCAEDSRTGGAGCDPAERTADGRRPCSGRRGSRPSRRAHVDLRHVIVDEAQDLSPMQLRMIGRRAPGAGACSATLRRQRPRVAHLVGGRCLSRSGRGKEGGVAKPRPHTRLPRAGPRARFCGDCSPSRADGAGDGVGSSRPASAACSRSRRRTLLDRRPGGSARGRGIPRGLHRRRAEATAATRLRGGRRRVRHT